jgi:HAD superfamily hydrolase (TIGR01450 family)
LSGNGTFRGCGRPLSESYDAALLDLDGVLYLGGQAIPGAAEAVIAAAGHGMRLAYVTNNASRSPHAIAAQLSGMGVPATADDVVTSAQAAAHVLADRLPAGAPVLVVGGMGLRLAVRARGLRPVTAAGERPLAVVQGYGPGIDYGVLTEAALAIRAGAWYVLTNADPTLPTPRGLQPGNGSLAQILVSATGQRPVVAGKPAGPLHAEAVERTGSKRPLVVGDRLDTDIEGAVRAGADSLLVFTGVTRPAELLLAPPQHRPSYISADLHGLNTSHPGVTTVDGGFSCGGWTASAVGGREWLAVSGSGDWVDGLRALCAAAWSAAAGGADGPEQGNGRAPGPEHGWADGPEHDGNTPEQRERAAGLLLEAIGASG